MNEAAARGALRRQVLPAAALAAAAASVVAVVLSGAAFAAVDRPLFAVGGFAVAGVARAGLAVARAPARRRGGAAGGPEPLEPAPRSPLDEHDRFLLAQRFRMVGNRYELSLLAADVRFDVYGRRIELRELFAASLLRSTWEVWDGAGTLVATAQERSVGGRAGARRRVPSTVS